MNPNKKFLTNLEVEITDMKDGIITKMKHNNLRYILQNEVSPPVKKKQQEKGEGKAS